MLRYVIVGSAALAALSTAACTGSRVGDGALYGAGAGAVAGEVVSGSPVTGAAIGAVGGAIVGAATDDDDDHHHRRRSEEHTSELQSLMRISYAVFCLNKKNTNINQQTNSRHRT